METSKLAELLKETADHHDPYEKSHAKHNWWDWYAPYMQARQQGKSTEEAEAEAGAYVELVLQHATVA